VLGWPTLAVADPAVSRLIAPFDLTLPLELGFYLVCSETHADRPKVVKFRVWLLDEIRMVLSGGLELRHGQT
jgi:LysR family glycine cleavage system transcriptional activator